MRTSSIFLVSLVVLAMSCAGPQRIPSNNWSEVAEKTIEATVLIESQFEFTDPDTGEVQTAKGVGTGVVLSSDGWIISNHHVIGDGFTLANIITVKFKDGRVFMVDKLFTFPKNDLALMKINARNLDFIKIRTGSVKVGEFCLAVGNPIPYMFVAKEGIVSQPIFTSYLPLWDKEEVRDIQLMAHSASVLPGNSGGALVDINGDLIGINEAYVPRKPVYGLAITIKTVRYVLDTVSGIIGKRIYTLAD